MRKLSTTRSVLPGCVFSIPLVRVYLRRGIQGLVAQTAPIPVTVESLGIATFTRLSHRVTHGVHVDDV